MAGIGAGDRQQKEDLKNVPLYLRFVLSFDKIEGWENVYNNFCLFEKIKVTRYLSGYKVYLLPSQPEQKFDDLRVLSFLNKLFLLYDKS